MKKLILVLSLLFLYDVAYTQEIIWEKSYNTGGEVIYFIESLNGGYLALGSYNGDVAKKVFKVDEKGNKEWELDFGSRDNPISGGFIYQPDEWEVRYAGMKCLHFSYLEDGYFYILNAKSSGEYLWHYFSWNDRGRLFGTPFQMKIKKENHFLVTSYYKYKGGKKCYLQKTDELGRKIWRKYYTDVSDYDHMGALTPIEISDGNYMFLYILARQATCAKYGLIKTDTAGNLLWKNGFNLNDTCNRYCTSHIHLCPDGGIATVFERKDFDGDSSFYNLVKTDKLGNVEWEKDYWNKDKDYSKPVHMCVTDDGGFLIGGWTAYWNNLKEEETMHLRDFYLVKTDSLGELEWEKVYGSEGWDVIWYVMQGSDGHYIVSGFKNGKAYLAKLRNTAVPVEEAEGNDVLFISNPYPQPASSYCMLRYTLPSDGRASIRVLDELGNTVDFPVNTYLSAGKHSLLLDVSSYNGGVYFCRLSHKDRVKTVKILVVK